MFILIGATPVVSPLTSGLGISWQRGVGFRRQTKVKSNDDWVPKQLFALAYQHALELGPIAAQGKRERPAPLAADLVAVVERTPELNWEQRRDQWKREHPKNVYASPRSIKEAYARANT